MSLFEECVEKAKEINPNFDENNMEHLDIMAKAFVLSNKKDLNLRQSYLNEVVKESYKLKILNMIAEGKFPREKIIEAELNVQELEKDIIEKKIEAIKECMN